MQLVQSQQRSADTHPASCPQILQLQRRQVPATYAVPHTYRYLQPSVYAQGYPFVMPAVQAVEKVEDAVESVEMA